MPLLQPKVYTESDYYNLPEDVRAELIDGQFYYQAAPSRAHQTILGEMYTAISNYLKSKNGPCRVYPAPFAVKLSADAENIVEPDISVICDRNKLTERGCTGAPDWVIEIVSPSSRRLDYYTKPALYRSAGVREYWIIDPIKHAVIVYDMEHDAGPVIYTFRDSIKANIYDDLVIDFSRFDLL